MIRLTKKGVVWLKEIGYDANTKTEYEVRGRYKEVRGRYKEESGLAESLDIQIGLTRIRLDKEHYIKGGK